MHGAHRGKGKHARMTVAEHIMRVTCYVEPRAWIVYQPAGYEHDYEVFWYEQDARDSLAILHDDGHDNCAVVPLYEPVA